MIARGHTARARLHRERVKLTAELFGPSTTARREEAINARLTEIDGMLFAPVVDEADRFAFASL